MMNLIQQVHAEYNENVLTDNYKNVNRMLWTAVNTPAATMVETNDYTYEEGKSLRLNIQGYASDETEFSPVVSDYFEFIVPKTGKYIFSVRALVPDTSPDLPNFVGRFFLSLVGGGPSIIPLDFKIGNNTEPEFTFEYGKWQTFFTEVTLTQGEVYTILGEVDKEVTWTGGPVNLYFAGFKLEYIEDKNYNIPTYYTKPMSSGGTSTAYIEVDYFATLENYHKTVAITANSFTVTLPSATHCLGKEIEVLNKGIGIPSIVALGGENIDGLSSKLIQPGTGIKVISNGIYWKINNIFRLETFNRTQWVQNIALTTINNATSLNLMTLITNASKLANGTDGGVNTLDIVSNGIKTNWKGAVMSHHIRLGLTIAVGTDQHYTLTLRRVVDNSIVASTLLNRNADTGFTSADFLTYTYGALDPFVTGGFYLSLDNNSGATVDLITSLNLLITTYFK